MREIKPDELGDWSYEVSEKDIETKSLEKLAKILAKRDVSKGLSNIDSIITEVYGPKVEFIELDDKKFIQSAELSSDELAHLSQSYLNHYLRLAGVML